MPQSHQESDSQQRFLQSVSLLSPLPKYAQAVFADATDDFIYNFYAISPAQIHTNHPALALSTRLLSIKPFKGQNQYETLELGRLLLGGSVDDDDGDGDDDDDDDNAD